MLRFFSVLSLSYVYHMSIIRLPFLRSTDGDVSEKRRRKGGDEAFLA